MMAAERFRSTTVVSMRKRMALTTWWTTDPLVDLWLDVSEYGCDEPPREDECQNDHDYKGNLPSA
jgi:hypothetical protein